MYVRLLLCAALLAGSACGKSDNKGGDKANDAAVATAAKKDAAGPDTSVAYPDEPAGLKKLIEDIERSAKLRDRGDDAPLYRLTQSLRLSDAKSWFGSHFDPPVSDKLIADYQVVFDNIGSLVDTVLEIRQKQGLTRVNVEAYVAANDSRAVLYQERALKQMKKGTSAKLYSVRLTDATGDKVFHLWSFVYHEGSFRFVGKMKAVAPNAPMVGGKDKFEYTFEDGSKLSAAN